MQTYWPSGPISAHRIILYALEPDRIFWFPLESTKLSIHGSFLATLNLASSWVETPTLPPPNPRYPRSRNDYGSFSINTFPAWAPTRLSTSAFHLSCLREFKVQPLAPSFLNPREVIFDFSPLVLATCDFVSRRLELSFPYLPSSWDAIGQQGVDSSKSMMCFRLIISWAHGVVLSRVS